jgi:hypothetical protein
MLFPANALLRPLLKFVVCFANGLHQDARASFMARPGLCSGPAAAVRRTTVYGPFINHNPAQRLRPLWSGGVWWPPPGWRGGVRGRWFEASVQLGLVGSAYGRRGAPRTVWESGAARRRKTRPCSHAHGTLPLSRIKMAMFNYLLGMCYLYSYSYKNILSVNLPILMHG